MDYIFIIYAYNNSAYNFFVHYSNIEDIHPNIDMELMNVTLFEYEFPWNKA